MRSTTSLVHHEELAQVVETFKRLYGEVMKVPFPREDAFICELHSSYGERANRHPDPLVAVVVREGDSHSHYVYFPPGHEAIAEFLLRELKRDDVFNVFTEENYQAFKECLRPHDDVPNILSKDAIRRYNKEVGRRAGQIFYLSVN